MMQTMAKYKAYKKDKEENGGFGVGLVETPEEREAPLAGAFLESFEV